MPLARSTTRPAWFLNLEGTPCGFLATFSGGEATADVLPDGGSKSFVRKHLGPPRYEPIRMSFGLGLEPALYEWIAAAWDGKLVRKAGSIVAVGPSGAVRELEFEDAVVAEVTLPQLDGSSKDPAFIELTVGPARTSWKKASGRVSAPAGKQKRWLPSNFKLEIDGLDCRRVSKVDAITVAGEPPVDFPSLRVTAAASSQQSWTDWHEEFVVKGLNDDANEKNGSLVYLSPDMKTKLGEVRFFNLGIFGLASDQEGAVARFIAKLYCEKMELAV